MTEGCEDEVMFGRVRMITKRLTFAEIGSCEANPVGYGMKLSDKEIEGAVKAYKSEEDATYTSWKADCLD